MFVVPLLSLFLPLLFLLLLHYCFWLNYPPGNSASVRRRYDALQARVKRHQQLVEEAVTRSRDFSSSLQAFLGPLAQLEAQCEGVVVSGGESLPLKVEEKVETVRVSGCGLEACGRGTV